MEDVVYSHLGHSSKRLKSGPGRGLDNGVISLGRGKVMIVSVDPVSAVPAFGMKMSAWLSVHLIASDLTSSGVDAEFATFSYNFPAPMTSAEREGYITSIGRECNRLGIAIAAGHTGTYPGGGLTVIGSGTMIGFAEEKGYVTPAMAQVGDSILMTKHAAIEATGSLAFSFPEFVKSKIGGQLARTARSELNICSTVEDARTARKIGLGRGGVTSMHDATEGGVLGALDEMATASKKLFEVDASLIPVTPEADGVCSAFGLNPLATMGEGALLITCGQDRVHPVELAMSRAGIEIREIGTVKQGTGLKISGGVWEKSKPSHERYWSVYEDAVRRGLR